MQLIYCPVPSATGFRMFRESILPSGRMIRARFDSALAHCRLRSSKRGSRGWAGYVGKSWSARAVSLGSTLRPPLFKEDLMYLDEQFRLKVGLAEMLKGGVIMDVTNAAQAVIAEKAGASAVMALERVPSDIRKDGGVARMANISIIREIMHTVSIPVMA